MLSAADLAYTRQTQGLTLPERAIVEHRESSDDGTGGWTEVTIYTADVPCRVAPLRVQAAEALIGGTLESGLPWHVTLPAEQPIEVDDRLNVGGELTGTPPSETVEGGRWFEVLAVYGAWTTETARQCLCMER